jgi:DNA end-binding protein Ku
MAARAMWKGTLKLGKLGFGVKLFAAVEDRAVHFHLLHERDQQRVKQRMVNPSTGEARERAEIVHGFEVKPGTFVQIRDDELGRLEPEPSRDITVECFVPLGAIEPVWYERPYYLAPDGKSPDYFALVRVLAEEQRVGLARWVMRRRTYHGALRTLGDYLTLSSLHSAAEVVPAPRVGAATRAPDARELAMAKQLVEALAGTFDPIQFKDEHRERVLELVAAKAKGKSIKPPPRERKRSARDLGTALEQSLKAISKRPKRQERLSA